MSSELVVGAVVVVLVLTNAWLVVVANLAYRTGYMRGQIVGLGGPKPRNYWRIVLNYAYGDKSMTRSEHADDPT